MRDPQPNSSGSAAPRQIPPGVRLLTSGFAALAGLEVIGVVASQVTMTVTLEAAASEAGLDPATTPEEARNLTRVGIILRDVVGMALAISFAWLAVTVRGSRNRARLAATVALGLGILAGVAGLGGDAHAVVTVTRGITVVLEIAVLVALWLQPSRGDLRGSAGSA